MLDFHLVSTCSSYFCLLALRTSISHTPEFYATSSLLYIILSVNPSHAAKHPSVAADQNTQQSLCQDPGLHYAGYTQQTKSNSAHIHPASLGQRDASDQQPSQYHCTHSPCCCHFGRNNFPGPINTVQHWENISEIATTELPNSLLIFSLIMYIQYNR